MMRAKMLGACLTASLATSGCGIASTTPWAGEATGPAEPTTYQAADGRDLLPLTLSPAERDALRAASERDGTPGWADYLSQTVIAVCRDRLGAPSLRARMAPICAEFEEDER